MNLSSLSLLAATAKDANSLQAWLSSAQSIGIVALGLGFVIFVHELGHFLVAKWCGVKVLRFYVGFDWFPLEKIGPIKIPHRLFHFTWGETEYGVGILPLGGYVKMLGQDDNPGNDNAEYTKETGAAEPPKEYDPRDYRAKPVWKRLLIICAGVTMNILTAPLMAAVAFWYGVPYLPTEVSGASPGGPAWIAGIGPGDKIVKIGDGERSENLRFEFDLPVAARINQGERDLDVLVRGRDGEERTLSFRPAKLESRKPTKVFGIPFGGHTQYILGVTHASSLEFRKVDEPWWERGTAISPRPEAGDKITHVDGQPIEHHWQMQAVFAANPDRSVRLTVNRPESKDTPARTLEMTVEPQSVKSVGFYVLGRVAAVRPNSPAAAAGLQAGDVIKAVAGQPIDDPLRLAGAILPYAGKSVALTIERGDKSLDVTLTPQSPMESALRRDGVFGGKIGLDSIGVAYELTNQVGGVDSTSDSKLKTGDLLVKFEIVPVDDAQAKSLKEEGYRGAIELDDQRNAWAHHQLTTAQNLPKGAKLKLHFKHDAESKVESIELVPQVAADWHSDDRLLPLGQMLNSRKANSAAEALALGYRETKEKAALVVQTVLMLVTGKVSRNDLSGPAGIARVAYSTAEGGVPRFLLFLCMLSANLAVMNMLPIPVLDGGHVVFLLAEALRGKPIDEKWQIYASLAGLALLLGTMLFATLNDLTWLFG